MEPDIRAQRGSRPARVRLAVIALVCTAATLGAAGLGVAGAAGQAGATVARVPAQAPGATTTTTAAAGAVPTITSNSVVVVEQTPGQVSVIEGGKPRVIAGGLSKPNGAAILPDGGIVVADSGNNRLVGVGGSFGATLKEIVQVPFPEGVGVGADGSLYVTLLLAGEVGKVDLQAGTYTKIAGDLKGPGDVAERDGSLYVTESTGGDVVEVAAGGQRSVVATGFQQPIGLVAGPGRTLYVADFKANAIVKVDDAGKSTEFAKVDAPVQLASAPFVLTPDLAAFGLVVSAKEGLVVLDNAAKRVSTIAIAQATGVATGAVTGATTPSTTTTTAVAPTSAPSTTAVPGTSRPGTSLAATPRTTRVRPTTTLAPIDDTPASSTGNILLFSLGVIALSAIALLAVFVVRRPKTMQKSGFEERPLDADSVVDAFGPCAAEEVEVAEAEGARDAVIVQREATEKRHADAVARVARNRERLAEATKVRARIEDERKEAQVKGPPTKDELGSTEIKPDELGLTTDAGREALAGFATGDLDAHELEERWRELGEQQAIDVVRQVGERRARLDPSKPWPDELRAVEAEEAAAAELAESERDIEFAEAEIQRLNERETEVLERIDAAHTALADCQARHRDAQRARASTAKAEARAARADAEAGAAQDDPPEGAGADVAGAPATAAASAPEPIETPTDAPAEAGAAVPAATIVTDAPRIWGGRPAKEQPAPDPVADQAAAPAATPAAATNAAADETDAPLGTRAEMLALIEAAKRSRREGSEGRAESPPDTDTGGTGDGPGTGDGTPA